MILSDVGLAWPRNYVFIFKILARNTFSNYPFLYLSLFFFKTLYYAHFLKTFNYILLGTGLFHFISLVTKTSWVIVPTLLFFSSSRVAKFIVFGGGGAYFEIV